MCFWDSRPGARSVKSVRRMANHMLKELEDVTAVSNCTKHEDMVVSQDGHVLSSLAATPLCFFEQ